MPDVYDLTRGDSPLIVSMPHCGTALPPGLEERLTPEARTLPDTDWHIPRLYDFAGGMGATVLAARYSRYVVDLNRPPGNESLYPGQATTGLCPETLFDGAPLYADGRGPGEAEVAERVETCWRPYHAALAEEIARVKDRHGFALLYDAHSIRSHVPRLFKGRLPDLNLGTAMGESCPSALREALALVLAEISTHGHPAVVDGRFIGGYITRHYGRPGESVFAVQMELAQAAYMEETPPFAFDEAKAAAFRPHLRKVLETLLGFRA
ncbi:N-formylglutamate deformylase [Caenispirillum salinarum]|uniref:N-formylglutamate deformylase n=1 Tax=Caenispirillum salinarum TaxID=859058 RepID=UPI00384AD5F6